MAGNHVTDMTSGPVFRHLFRFSVPLILGNLLQLSYNMVDTIVIGRFAGGAALAAVGTCDQIMNLLILGVSGLCLGAAVLMGNFFGSKDYGRLLDELKTTVGLGLIFSLAVLLAGLPLTRVILKLMQTQEEAFPDAMVYLCIVFLGVPFTCLYNIYAAALRGVGDSRTPVRFLMVSCGLNICLDLILVAGFRLGVLGAGLATLAAQAVSAALCMISVNAHVPVLRFSWRSLRISRELAGKTLSYGGLTALQQCAQPIGNLVIQGSVNALGVSAAAAFSACRKIEDIGLLPGRSISAAMTALIAQNEGAGKRERTEKGFRSGMLLEACAGAAVCLLVALLRKPLMTLFSEDGLIVEEGIRYFSVIMFFYWLPCLSNGIQGYFRGTGHMKTSLAATVTQISVRVGFTLITVSSEGIPGVGIACVAGWLAMLAWTVPFRIYLRRKKS